MRLHAALAGALISATAALESVPADAFRSVARGRVAVVDDFLARDVSPRCGATLRGTTACRGASVAPVAATPSTRATQPTRDTKLKRRNERFVLRGSVWRDFAGIGRGTARNRVPRRWTK